MSINNPFRHQPNSSLATIALTALVYLLGAGLRLFNLGKHGLFLDEAWSWAVTRLPLAEILHLPEHDPHPILYYVFLKGSLAVLPDTEAGIRTFGALCSLASLAALLFFAHRWRRSFFHPVRSDRQGSQVMLFAGFFLALSTFDLYYAQEARMYTLLALLWFISYACLVEALLGHHRYLLGWGIAGSLMSWTHFYGLIVAYSQVIFLLVYFALKARHFSQSGSHIRTMLAASLTLLGIGTTPIIAIAWQNRMVETGGAWLAQPVDLLALFNLGSVGLVAARPYIFHGNLLALPLFDRLPLSETSSLWIWGVLGFLTSGIFVLRALYQEFKPGGIRRWHALLALTCMSLPLVIFAYTLLFNLSQWALKPFLGGVYIYYLWAGMGLSRAHKPARLVVGAVVACLSLFSIIPYFSTWQKTDTPQAFASFSPTTVDSRFDDQSVVLLDRAYYAPLAFYYLGDQATIWGILPSAATDSDSQVTSEAVSTFNLYQVSAPGILPEDFQSLSCDSLAVENIETLWVYGYFHHIDQELPSWPACLDNKTIFTYYSGTWTAFNH